MFHRELINVLQVLYSISSFGYYYGGHALFSNFLQKIVHSGFLLPSPGFVEAPYIFDRGENCSD